LTGLTSSTGIKCRDQCFFSFLGGIRCIGNSCLGQVPEITHLVGLPVLLETNEPRVEIVNDWDTGKSSRGRRGNIKLLPVGGRNLQSRIQGDASVERAEHRKRIDVGNVPVGPVMALIGSQVLEQVRHPGTFGSPEHHSDQFLTSTSIREYLICELFVEGNP